MNKTAASPPIKFWEVSSSFFALRRKKRTAHLPKFYRRRSRRFIHAKIVKEPYFTLPNHSFNLPLPTYPY
jgi:hypothetical protein